MYIVGLPVTSSVKKKHWCSDGLKDISLMQPSSLSSELDVVKHNCTFS